MFIINNKSYSYSHSTKYFSNVAEISCNVQTMLIMIYLMIHAYFFLAWYMKPHISSSFRFLCFLRRCFASIAVGELHIGHCRSIRPSVNNMKYNNKCFIPTHIRTYIFKFQRSTSWIYTVKVFFTMSCITFLLEIPTFIILETNLWLDLQAFIKPNDNNKSSLLSSFALKKIWRVSSKMSLK